MQLARWLPSCAGLSGTLQIWAWHVPGSVQGGEIHLSITFSFQIMHLPDASNVKNCNPFLWAGLCWLSGRALQQILPGLLIWPHCLPDAEGIAWVPLLWPRQDRAKPPLGLRHWSFALARDLSWCFLAPYSFSSGKFSLWHPTSATVGFLGLKSIQEGNLVFF